MTILQITQIRLKYFLKNALFLLISILLCESALLPSQLHADSDSHPKSVAFFYGKEIPWELMSVHDWLVINPDIAENLHTAPSKHLELFGYVSIGEINRMSSHFSEIKKEWIIGENKDWETVIIDIRNTEYRQFLLNNLKAISIKNISNFFFDTIDSYQLVLKDENKKQYETSLIEFFKELKRTFPSGKIIINRGFEIIDQVQDLIDAVAAESLFKGLDIKDKSYINVKESDRNWLISKLNDAAKLGIIPIAIDYIDPKDHQLAEETVSLISELGFIPWVTDKDLKTVGHGSYKNAKKRRILLFYEEEAVKNVVFSQVHRFLSASIEYLGFIPEPYNFNAGLPEEYLADRFA
ncbi:MAG: endo alpha-1,4 polygalactosaminidase [Planctomycetes bacterium]|nr:endo alpha-1,4 polygalactosaminidase [Planctomycetota bacterium]